MTDLHCHILPGIDDGAKDTAVSLELLRREYEDGVRNIIRCGSSVERIDLYIRLEFRLSQVNREVSMLLNRLYKTKLEVNQESLDHLVDAALDSQKPVPEHSDMLNWVDTLFAL